MEIRKFKAYINVDTKKQQFTSKLYVSGYANTGILRGQHKLEMNCNAPVKKNETIEKYIGSSLEFFELFENFKNNNTDRTVVHGGVTRDHSGYVGAYMAAYNNTEAEMIIYVGGQMFTSTIQKLDDYENHLSAKNFDMVKYVQETRN